MDLFVSLCKLSKLVSILVHHNNNDSNDSNDNNDSHDSNANDITISYFDNEFSNCRCYLDVCMWPWGIDGSSSNLH